MISELAVKPPSASRNNPLRMGLMVKREVPHPLITAGVVTVGQRPVLSVPACLQH